MIPIPEWKREIRIGGTSPTWCASASASPISSCVSRIAAARRLSSSCFVHPPGNATSPDHGSPARRARSTKHTLRASESPARTMATDARRVAGVLSAGSGAESALRICSILGITPQRYRSAHVHIRDRSTNSRDTARYSPTGIVEFRRTADRLRTCRLPPPMLYLTMFSSAFLAATIVPFASEITLTVALAAGGAVHWLIIVATLGNTLGATVNWVARAVHRALPRPRVVPCRFEAARARASVVPALRGLVSAARLAAGHRRPADGACRHDARAHRAVPDPGGGREGAALRRSRPRRGRCDRALTQPRYSARETMRILRNSPWASIARSPVTMICASAASAHSSDSVVRLVGQDRE